MVKGLEKCPECGKTVRPGKRTFPHPQTAECRIRKTHLAYDARGWRMIGFKHAGILQAAGIDVERAPGAVKLEVTRSTTPDGLKSTTEREVVSDVYFTSKSAALACEALIRIRMTPELRQYAVRLLFDHPEYVAAIDTVRRLEGASGLPRYVVELARSHGWTR